MVFLLDFSLEEKTDISRKASKTNGLEDKMEWKMERRNG
jgi:hypothetical protein